MIPFTRLFRIPGFLTGLLLLLAVSVSAETRYTAVLDGPTSGNSSTATGTASLVLNDAQTEVDYVVSLNGLSSPEFAAHFHNAPPGKAGPSLWTLVPGNYKVGVWPVGPFEVGELNAGRVYVNIHTEIYPTGEIRGDISFKTVAAEAASWGSVKALFD